MKNPMEVLRMKEQEITRVRKEVEALRIAAQLLGDESHSSQAQAPDLRKPSDLQ